MNFISKSNLISLINPIRNIRIRNIGCLLCVLAVAAMLPACSDNVAEGLYADNDSEITLGVSASGLENGKLEIGSAQASTVFTVTSTSRWIVEISDCEGSWCQVVYGDNTTAEETEPMGNGVFLVDASPNRSKEKRECNVTIYGIESDGTHIPGKVIDIHLTQDGQSIEVDYSGDVISVYGTSKGTEPLVKVTANQGWEASTSQPWVKIVPGAGMTGTSYDPDGSTEEKTLSFNISVEANPGASVRYAEVTIKSLSNAFTPVRLNITQMGSTETFLVSPANVPDINQRGDTIEFQVLSPRETWQVTAISAGDWLTLDRTSGEASNEAVIVKAFIPENPQFTDRQAAIIFTREGDMGESIVTVNQKGDPYASGSEEQVNLPAVSNAWVVSGWTSTTANVMAYYSSSSIEVTGCGAYLTEDGGSGDIHTYEGYLHNNAIGVPIDNLKPNTTYMVWCFVEYTLNGERKTAEGGRCRFTTPEKDEEAGGTPEIGDNNPPSNK